jgi:hypothetical protein
MSGTGVSVIIHETDERLELYALGRLPESEVAAVEEHLLLCETCQDRLDEAEAFALPMREAIASEPEPETETGWLTRLGLGQPAPGAWWRNKVVWAGAFTAVVCGAGLYLQVGRNSILTTASLQLTAMRGAVASVSAARETDISLADAPSGPALRVEVVDSAGSKIWGGTPEGSQHKVSLTKQLSPGAYFVRLYDESGSAGTETLLHEYAFVVRDPR